MREAIAQLWFGPGNNNVFPDIKQFFPVFGGWSGFNHNKRHSLAAWFVAGRSSEHALSPLVPSDGVSIPPRGKDATPLSWEWDFMDENDTVHKVTII